MEVTKIKVSDYYGNPSYYSVMPKALFDLLEVATLKGDEFVLFDKSEFDLMISNHSKKMELCKN